MSAFQNPLNFDFVPALEAAFDRLLEELNTLAADEFLPSPDSLTTVDRGYDETGWYYLDLHGEAGSRANRLRCPALAKTCLAVPGMVNGGISLLRPGTHLYPHRGELQDVLRCHLPLVVPNGDLGLRAAGETRRWETGRCLIFDDTIEHEAWNHGDGDRVILLVTFRRADFACGSS